ncbi:hypothetical protein [Nocardiopsis sp. CNS-639]|uniref:hypothetical protein n=1 Tax=Nocardiopsis sp. CNS-639 TaxID=1169153 RepID=UPI0012DD75CF|nr:hypothetical protein [Nocardiopsis sp. CNS-639]
MTRKKKMPLRGSFSSALTSKKETVDAIRDFINNTEDAWISYKKPPFDWSTGEHVKETDFLLGRSEWLSDSESQLEEAVRSKSFLVVCRYPDGGLLSVDFSNRSWEVIDRSQAVDSEILELKNKLKGAVVSKFLSAGWGVTLLAGYFTFAFAVLSLDLFVGLIVDQEVRRGFFFGEGDVTPPVTFPEDLTRRAIFLVTPFLMLAGVLVFALRFMSGGLRVWPEKINRDLFHSMGYKVKRDFIPSSANNFWVAILAALAGMIVTKLFL